MLDFKKTIDDIAALPPLREVIRAHDLRAEKSLGQNFLLDLNLTDKIARVAGDLSGVHVIEIGPGPGGLTRALLKTNAAHVSAIEFDTRAVNALADLKDTASGRLEILAQDALKTNIFDIAAPAHKIAVIANLPYNIATPLLIGWLKSIYEAPTRCHAMVLMFQKEVAQRIVAETNTKHYARLSVISQWLCESKKMFDIAPRAFTPAPKVTSSIVHFVPKAFDVNMPRPAFNTMESITKAAFGQRRKMIKTSLKMYESACNTCGIDMTSRAENLSVEDYMRIASAVENSN